MKSMIEQCLRRLGRLARRDICVVFVVATLSSCTVGYAQGPHSRPAEWSGIEQILIRAGASVADIVMFEEDAKYASPQELADYEQYLAHQSAAALT
jgi:hypothetical protein